MEEITKHLGDIGTFGIFALAVIWMVLKYVVPAVRNGKKEEAPPPQANTQPADITVQMSTMVAHTAACVEMLRDLHRWQQKEPVECAMKNVCDELRETRVTLCDKQNETNKSIQGLREKVIEWAARTRKSTK